MKSWLATGVTQNYGQQLAHGVIGSLAWQLLGVAGLIAFAVAAIRFSVDRGSPNPFRVLAAVFGLGLLLQIYSFLPDSIDSTMRSAAESVSSGGAFEQFSQTFMDGVMKHFAINVSAAKGSGATSSTSSTRWDKIQSFWQSATAIASTVADNPENVATQYVTGALSGILSSLTVFAAIVFFELFSILRIVLYQVLYAVGPLVIACAVLPGASGLLGRWLTAVFEISSWQLIGAIVFELVAKSSAATVYAADSDNFVALCVANLVFACSIMLIPAIAHRIVGSGFSAIGQSIHSTLMSGAQTVATAGVAAMPAAAAAAAPYVVRGVSAAAGKIGEISSAVGGAAVGAMSVSAPPPSLAFTPGPMQGPSADRPRDSSPAAAPSSQGGAPQPQAAQPQSITQERARQRASQNDEPRQVAVHRGGDQRDMNPNKKDER